MDILTDTIINADILEVLPQIPAGTFDAVITDMPFEQEAHCRGFAAKRELFKKMAQWTNLKNDWYNESILLEYVRICKFPNMFLFGGKRDVYKMLKFAEEHNYNYHILPVCKKAPIPMTKNTWLSNEYAVHITDRKLTYTTDYNLKIPYFIVGGWKTTGHPNEKDLAMTKRVVANITPVGGFIFDGFMGSGTTALACQQLGRHFFGCDINKEFCDMSIQRLEEDKKKGALIL